MANYDLTIKFQDDDLDTVFKADEKVALMKSVGASGEAGNVVWVAFYPFESSTVSWETVYGVYASQTEVQDGAQIQKASDAEAIEKTNRNFEEPGKFGEPEPANNLSDGSYRVTNQYQREPILTFGMQQGVVINGRSEPDQPINAVQVPRTHDAVFTPFEEVTIFLSAAFESSFIVTEVASPMTTVKFGGGVYSRTVEYDSKTGLFVAASE